MPYSITDSEASCDGFAVVKDDDGEVMGCHDTEADAQDQLTALNIAEAEKSLLAVKATQDEIGERYDAFQDAVNMSASEIEEWGETECANQASQNPSAVRERVIGLLRTSKDDWGDREYEQAGRVTSFIARMRGVEQGETSGDCPSDRDISLRNWGYDPTKSTRTTTRTAKMQHEYSEGDDVMWESSGGMASGRVIRVVTSGTVSPSTSDREFDASEDDPRFVIQLMDDDGELRTDDDGEPVTVVHTGQALSMKSRGYMIGDTLVYPGSGVKDLSDKGDIGGYLVVFGDEGATDLERDFFTKDSDFWLNGGEGLSHVLYGHGSDPELGRRRLTKAPGRLVLKDAGVWMEAQMQARDEYEEMILHLAQQGKLGLSSGTASHLVETKSMGKATHLTTWPLGLDASLTPQPAEPRTKVQPLKHTRIQTLKQIRTGTVPDEANAEQAIEAIDDYLKHSFPGAATADVDGAISSIDEFLR